MDATTEAVEAAARTAYEERRADEQRAADATKDGRGIPAPWEGAGAVVQSMWKRHVFPLVQAAVRALPEPPPPCPCMELAAMTGGPDGPGR